MRRPRVELVSIRIRGYRSCKDTSVTIEPDVTALIGKNGAGKTNVVQGIYLLRRPLRRRSRKAEKDTNAITCVLTAMFRVYHKKVGLRLRLNLRPSEIGNLEDVIQVSETWDLRDFGAQQQWASISLHEYVPAEHEYVSAEGEPGVYIVREVRGPVFQTRTKDGAISISQPTKEALAAFQAVQEFRSQLTYYSASQFTNAASCPAFFEVDEDGDLRENMGTRENPHSRFLYDLYSLSKRDSALYANYVSLVGRGGLQLIDRFAWAKANVSTRAVDVRSGGRLLKRKRVRTLIIPTTYIGRDKLSYNQLSEGTFRTLALLFYIMTDKSRFLLLEEPEVCVHHGLLTSVLEILKRYSHRKQVVLSTHSEFVLDSLAPEQVRLTSKVLAKGTTVKAIPEAMTKRDFAALREYLKDAGTLGEYWRHSGFGR